jgi:hypothetical protein
MCRVRQNGKAGKGPSPRDFHHQKSKDQQQPKGQGARCEIVMMTVV